MAKDNKRQEYINELCDLIHERTGKDTEKWLMPQVRATASNMLILEKIEDELLASESFITFVPGSMGQYKNEVNPLLAHYDKIQRTLLAQFEALGLNYSTTPSKVKEDTKQADVEQDPTYLWMKGKH